jgi:hypothetical protein
VGDYEVADYFGDGHDEAERVNVEGYQEQGGFPSLLFPSTHRDGTDTNQGILAINQDPPGWAATTFTPAGQPGPVSGKLYKYFAGPLSDGVVVGLVAADSAETLTVNFSDAPGLGPGTFSWTELYSGRTGMGTTASADLENHDMAVFKMV